MLKRTVSEHLHILRRGAGKTTRGAKRGPNTRSLNFSHSLSSRLHNGKKHSLKGCEEVFMKSSSVGFILPASGGEGNPSPHPIPVKSRGLKSTSPRTQETGQQGDWSPAEALPSHLKLSSGAKPGEEREGRSKGMKVKQRKETTQRRTRVLAPASVFACWTPSLEACPRPNFGSVLRAPALLALGQR